MPKTTSPAGSGSDRNASAKPALLTLAACAAATLLALGCERQSDSSMRSAMDVGSGLLRGGQATEAAAVLEPEANRTAAPGATLHLKNTLGHAKLSAARTKAAELQTVYLDILRLEGEIGQLANAVGVGNTLVDGYRRQDPAAARQRIRERIAEAQGGPDKSEWVKVGRDPIATLTATRQRVSQLQEQVAAKQDQIRKLEAERTSAAREADELRAAADALKGREGVAAFARASAGRKEVSLISSRIDTASAELVPLERDLAVQKGQQAIVESYIAALQAQDKLLSTGFEAVAQQISNQQAVSKGVASSATPPAEGTEAATIAAKTQQLTARLAEADTLHKDAEALFTAAAAAYQGAFTEANNLRTELQARLERYRDKEKNLESMTQAHLRTTWPSAYRLQQGIALSELGRLHADRAAALGARESLTATLTPIMKTAGLEVPAGLGGEAGEAKAARDAASENFARAITELDGAADNIQGNDPEKRRLSATLSRIFTYNAWSQMLARAGDASEAKAKLDEAVKLRDNLVSEGETKLPVELPGILAISPAAPSTNPAGTP